MTRPWCCQQQFISIFQQTCNLGLLFLQLLHCETGSECPMQLWIVSRKSWFKLSISDDPGMKTIRGLMSLCLYQLLREISCPLADKRSGMFTIQSASLAMGHLVLSRQYRLVLLECVCLKLSSHAVRRTTCSCLYGTFVDVSLRLTLLDKSCPAGAETLLQFAPMMSPDPGPTW